MTGAGSARWWLLLGLAVGVAQACGDGESTAVGPSVQGGAAGSGLPASLADCRPASGEVPRLKLTPVAEDVGDVVHAAWAPGETDRFFIVNRTGTVRLVEQGNMLEDAFLELEVDSAYVENGLLGLAFHPDYVDNGLFYLSYVAPRVPVEEGVVVYGNLVVAEYQRDPADPNHALPEPRRVLFDWEQPTAKHKAGTLAFDGQGRLLIAVGNAGVPEASADPAALRGKVLRIDPAIDGETYGVPADNPQLDGWAPEVLEMGLRNPWRISLDPCTDDLYIGDVGSGQFEEINVAPAGEHGHDFGFPFLEGNACYKALFPDCDPEAEAVGRTAPASGFEHCTSCAVMGGSVYRGQAIPALRGTYVYADLAGQLWSLVYRDGAVEDERELTGEVNPDDIGGLTAVVGDNNGELYVLSRSEHAVYRLDPVE